MLHLDRKLLPLDAAYLVRWEEQQSLLRELIQQEGGERSRRGRLEGGMEGGAKEGRGRRPRKRLGVRRRFAR